MLGKRSTSTFKTLSLPHTEILYSLSNDCPFTLLCPQSLVTSNLFPISTNLPILDISYK